MGILAGVSHDIAYVNFVQQGDMVVVEGLSSGKLKNGAEWRAGTTHAGSWCDDFEIRDFSIQRCHVYLDPDYADADTERYPLAQRRAHDALLDSHSCNPMDSKPRTCMIVARSAAPCAIR